MTNLSFHLFKIKKINEDEVFNIQLEATDAEGDELTYGATADNDAIIKVVKKHSNCNT